MRNLLTAFLLVLPIWLNAQSYPEYSSKTVNDFANILSADIETRLRSKLVSLEKDTSIELTVVTLETQETFAKDVRLESFATDLFNHWGVGKAQSNNGILVLVISADRAMRIELGSGFGSDFDRAAARVVEDSFLPEFRTGDYAAGILKGVDEIIQNIAKPFAAGQAPPGSSDDTWLVWLIGIVFVAAVAPNLIGQRLRDALRKCPGCLKRGRTKSHREILQHETQTASGQARVTIVCDNCGRRHTKIVEIAAHRDSHSAGSFGGGRSSGGGASGRW